MQAARPLHSATRASPRRSRACRRTSPACKATSRPARTSTSDRQQIMRILVGNDDGIESPGLHALARAARSLSDDVWVIAPERKWTAGSHQLTLDRDLILTKR